MSQFHKQHNQKYKMLNLIFRCVCVHEHHNHHCYCINNYSYCLGCCKAKWLCTRKNTLPLWYFQIHIAFFGELNQICAFCCLPPSTFCPQEKENCLRVCLYVLCVHVRYFFFPSDCKLFTRKCLNMPLALICCSKGNRDSFDYVIFLLVRSREHTPRELKEHRARAWQQQKKFHH